MADYNEPYLTLKLNGIIYDTPAYDLPMDVWSEGQNIRFTDGSAEKFEGDSEVFGTLLNAPDWFIPVGYGVNYYWVYANQTAIAVTDMASHFDITPVAGVNANLDINWNGGLVNNYVVMNNGVEPPIWWDGATSNVMTALPAWPANQLAGVIRPYKNYLVAMNISDAAGEYPDLIQWSDAALPGGVPDSWDVADPTKDAGETTLSDTPGEIVDGAPLGDSFYIYKRNAVYAMQYTGGQFIHSFRRVYADIGAMATNCIGVLDNRHLVLTSNDLIVHDGSSPPQSILDRRMREWLFNTINEAYYSRSFIVPYHIKNEMWVCFPTGDSEFADTALVWNYVDNQIGLREINQVRHIASGVVDPGEDTTWDSDTNTWDVDSSIWNERGYSPTAFSLVIGDRTNSKFLEVDVGDTFNGTPFTSYIARDSMPLIDRHNLKLVKAVYPRMSSTAATTVKFRIGSQMHATDPITWCTERDFVIGVDDKIDLLKKGRYFSFRFSSGTDINWKLHSFDVEIERAERR